MVSAYACSNKRECGNANSLLKPCSRICEFVLAAETAQTQASVRRNQIGNYLIAELECVRARDGERERYLRVAVERMDQIGGASAPAGLVPRPIGHARLPLDRLIFVREKLRRDRDRSGHVLKARDRRDQCPDVRHHREFALIKKILQLGHARMKSERVSPPPACTVIGRIEFNGMASSPRAAA